MPRLDRTQVLSRFFPELAAGSGSEVQRRVGVQACRLVLLDMLGAYTNARAEKGPGVLVIRMNGDQRNVDFMSEADIELDLQIAASSHDGAASDFFKLLLAAIGANNHDRYALFMMVEDQGTALVPVPFDSPEEVIAEQLKELAP
jgi:hypothetical protein